MCKQYDPASPQASMPPTGKQLSLVGSFSQGGTSSLGSVSLARSMTLSTARARTANTQSASTYNMFSESICTLELAGLHEPGALQDAVGGQSEYYSCCCPPKVSDATMGF